MIGICGGGYMDNTLEEKYIEIQKQLYQQVNFKDTISLSSVHLVAGIDLAYWKIDEVEYAVCCIVVLDYETHSVIEEVEYVGKVEVPYISGCLAFREIPFVIEAYQKLKTNPDILFFDGNGYLHQRHMGLATHAGIVLEKPSIGIAKSYYSIENTKFLMPPNEKGAYTDIIVNGEVYGRTLRTQKDVNPIFLSIGNKIDLDTAMILTNALISKESRIPIPTRLADIMTHDRRKKYQSIIL